MRLIAGSDEYSNDLGLFIKGFQHIDGAMAARYECFILAHDILEHQNGPKEIGSVWDELEALGGMLQVRGRHGTLMHKNEFHSVEVNLATDVIRMFDEWDGYAPPSTTRRHDYDDTFHDILGIAHEGIPKEWGSSVDPEPYLTVALHRMRAGFNKSQRRFGYGYEGAELFKAIAEAAEKTRPEYKGQEFILTYGKGRATIQETYE